MKESVLVFRHPELSGGITTLTVRCKLLCSNGYQDRSRWCLLTIIHAEVPLSECSKNYVSSMWSVVQCGV